MNMYFFLRIISYRKKCLLGLGEAFWCCFVKFLGCSVSKQWGDGSFLFSWVKTPPWWAQILVGWAQTCIYAALNLKLQHTVTNETDLPSTRSFGVVGTATQVWLKSHQPHAQSHGGEIFLHVLSSSRSILEDPPSISEGCGGRVTDYRITVRVFLSYPAASLTWQQMQGSRCGKEMLEWTAWSNFLCNKYLDRYLVQNTTFVNC